MQRITNKNTPPNIKNSVSDVQHHFSKGYSCSQSVVMIYAKKLGFDTESVLRISSGFGGGMAFGEVCGAAAGAIMVIGMKYSSPNKTTDDYTKNMIYEVSYEVSKPVFLFVDRLQAADGEQDFRGRVPVCLWKSP